MTTRFTVPDATCGHCKQTIESAVSGIEGVRSVGLDLESHTLTIEHDPSVAATDLAQAVTAAGYNPEV